MQSRKEKSRQQVIPETTFKTKMLSPFQGIFLLLFLILVTLSSDLAFAGSATLTWNPATTNADGTPLVNLAGYKVYSRTSTGQYGTPVDVGNQTSYVANGLAPGTYFFAVTTYNTAGYESALSNDQSKIIASLAPVITAIAASNVSTSGATVTWTTDINATSQVEYGITTAYGSLTSLDSALLINHSQSVSALQPGTTYHFRVRSDNGSGNLSVSGDYTFSTSPVNTTGPALSAITGNNITASSATITWTTNIASTSQVEFGTSTAYGQLTQLDSSLTTAHNQALSGLQASTTYHYRVKSSDGSGNLSTSGDNSFTTSGLPGGGSNLPSTGSSAGPVSASAAGGCGLIAPREGKSANPGAGADMIAILAAGALYLLRRGMKGEAISGIY